MRLLMVDSRQAAAVQLGEVGAQRASGRSCPVDAGDALEPGQVLLHGRAVGTTGVR